MCGGTYLGANLAIQMSKFLEEWEIYSAEDDDEEND
jgi:hypothetical protein